MRDRITVYEADEGNLTFATALRGAAADLKAALPLLWRLFVRDFTAQFRQRLLGYFWIVLSPILSIAGYWFMAATGFLRPGQIGLPYVLYLYIGTGIWGLFLVTMSTINASILSNGDLLMRTSAPPIALALSGVANLFYAVFVNSVVLALLLAVARFVPSPLVILYPLFMIPVMVLGIGIGLVLASIGVIARDITTIALSGFGVLMFLTPVIYDARFGHPLLDLIVWLNPLTYLVSFPRMVTMLGDATLWTGYLMACMLAVLALLLGTFCFYLVKDRMVERL